MENLNRISNAQSQETLRHGQANSELKTTICPRQVQELLAELRMK